MQAHLQRHDVGQRVVGVRLHLGQPGLQRQQAPAGRGGGAQQTSSSQTGLRAAQRPAACSTEPRPSPATWHPALRPPRTRACRAAPRASPPPCAAWPPACLLGVCEGAQSTGWEGGCVRPFGGAPRALQRRCLPTAAQGAGPMGAGWRAAAARPGGGSWSATARHARTKALIVQAGAHGGGLGVGGGQSPGKRALRVPPARVHVVQHPLRGSARASGRKHELWRHREQASGSPCRPAPAAGRLTRVVRVGMARGLQ